MFWNVFSRLLSVLFCNENTMNADEFICTVVRQQSHKTVVQMFVVQKFGSDSLLNHLIFFFGWNVSSQFHCICYMVILIDGIFVGNKKKWNKTSFSSSFDLALLVTKTRLCCKVLRIFNFFFWFHIASGNEPVQEWTWKKVKYLRTLTEKIRTIECCSNNMIDSMFYMKFKN